MLSPMGGFLEYLLAFHERLMLSREHQECVRALAEKVCELFPESVDREIPPQTADAIRELWMCRVSAPLTLSVDSIPQDDQLERAQAPCQFSSGNTTPSDSRTSTD